MTTNDPFNIPEIAIGPPRRVRKRRGGWWIIVLFAAFGGAVWGISAWTRDSSVRAPRLTGSLWRADVDERPLLFHVTEEERVQRRIPSYARRRYWFNVNYSKFLLHARDGRTGALVVETELARIDNAPSGQGPEILGPDGDVLWIWNGDLEGRSVSTLEPVWSGASLRARNPQTGDKIPTERKYVKLLGKLDALVFKGKDALFYQVDPASGVITPLDEVTLASHFRPGKAQEAFQYLYPTSDSLWGTSPMSLLWTTATSDDRWYALLTREQRAELFDNPGGGAEPWGEFSRSLYAAPYELEWRPVLGRHEIKLNLAAVIQVGDAQFLMGGFLKRPQGDSLWAVDEGRSYLVMHRQEIGDESPWLISRLGLDGSVHWTSSTGLADVHHLIDGGGVVVITGFVQSMRAARMRPDVMVFINEMSGEGHALDLVKNETRPLTRTTTEESQH